LLVAAEYGRRNDGGHVRSVVYLPMNTLRKEPSARCSMQKP
jgi:hypothetical protein